MLCSNSQIPVILQGMPFGVTETCVINLINIIRPCTLIYGAIVPLFLDGWSNSEESDAEKKFLYLRLRAATNKEGLCQTRT